MSKLKTNTIQHTGGSADNLTLDNSQNVTAEGNLTVDGNVSVGTTTSIQKLTIDGGGISIDNGWNTQWGANASRAYIQGEDATGNNRLIFGTNNTERLRLDSNGNVWLNGNGSYNTDRQVFNADGTSGLVEATNELNIFQNKSSSGGLYIGYKDIANGGTITDYHFYTGQGNDTKANISCANLAVAAGGGIDFSATSDAGGKTSELLDDYEEGTWTPADASGQSISYTDTAGNCNYTKIGRTVIANFTVTFLSTSNGHEAKIGGLPYTSINTTNSNAAVAVSEHSDDQSTTMIVVENQSYIVILHCHNGVDARTNAECSGKNYRGTVIYQTN